MNFAGALIGLLALTACDDDQVVVNPTPEEPLPVESTINASLREFQVTLDDNVVTEGEITFVVTNNGTHEHEFLVVATDLAADDLPTNDDGSYDEDGPGTNLIDEIEEFPPGQTEELTLDLGPGHYVVLCNVVVGSGDDAISHYNRGMFNDFDVESEVEPQ